MCRSVRACRRRPPSRGLSRTRSRSCGSSTSTGCSSHSPAVPPGTCSSAPPPGSWTRWPPSSAAFIDCRTQEAETIDLKLAENDLAILVIDTQVEHQHASGGYRERRASCDAGAAALGVASLRDIAPGDLPRARELLDDVTFRRVRHVVTENERVLDT